MCWRRARTVNAWRALCPGRSWATRIRTDKVTCSPQSLGQNMSAGTQPKQSTRAPTARNASWLQPWRSAPSKEQKQTKYFIYHTWHRCCVMLDGCLAKEPHKKKLKNALFVDLSTTKRKILTVTESNERECRARPFWESEHSTKSGGLSLEVSSLM